MTLPGVDRLVKALAAVGEEATDKAVHLAAAETVADGARTFAPRGPTGLTVRSLRASGAKGAGVVRAGGPRVPWVVPGHFGAPPPRPQGGYMRPNPWLYKGGDARADEVLDLFHRKTNAALRRQGLT